ncbi:hypothetical protein D3C85_1171290 [compost metagenome]
MVEKPCFSATEPSRGGSAIWTDMTRLLPPSSALALKTAAAVDPEPAKKSMTISSPCPFVAIPRIRRISFVGLGVSKTAAPKSSFISAPPSSVVPDDL